MEANQNQEVEAVKETTTAKTEKKGKGGNSVIVNIWNKVPEDTRKWLKFAFIAILAIWAFWPIFTGKTSFWGFPKSEKVAVAPAPVIETPTPAQKVAEPCTEEGRSLSEILECDDDAQLLRDLEQIVSKLRTKEDVLRAFDEIERLRNKLGYVDHTKYQQKRTETTVSIKRAATKSVSRSVAAAPCSTVVNNYYGYSKTNSDQTVQEAVRRTTSSVATTSSQTRVQTGCPDECPDNVIRVFNQKKTEYIDFPRTKQGRKEALAFIEFKNATYDYIPDEAELPD